MKARETHRIARCATSRVETGPNTTAVISGAQIGAQRFEGDA